MSRFTQNILDSRKQLAAGFVPEFKEDIEEGGCGVVGFAASVPVSGRHIFEPSIQMHNRGNGKGGGIAAACLEPKQLGVDETILRDDYIIQIALLDPKAESEVEEGFIKPYLKIDHKTKIKPEVDYRQLGLDVCPPDIVRYFARVKDDVLKKFAKDNNMAEAPLRFVEDEFIYQNSFLLNKKFYASLGDKRAFVLSHARNLVIFKIVGYAEQVVQYYCLDDLKANIWIAHQRYPTKGRVWHPAGAHPFIGMNEALVHNGDFANYFSISEYLRQHNVVPLFLTDTEVSVLLFDLWHRVLNYPIEYVIEALAPTTELDFECLPQEKKKIYKALQNQHMHGSPDGPWFFIIAQSNPDVGKFRLLGITDTAMLRPQVFALQEGDVSIGLVGSEKQAIDATLNSLSKEDSRFRPIADRYWNARGGSHTDGGAFVFTVEQNNGSTRLCCADKFGKAITSAQGDWKVDLNSSPEVPDKAEIISREINSAASQNAAGKFFIHISSRISSWDFGYLRWFVGQIEQTAKSGPKQFEWALNILSLLNDRRYDCGNMRRSVVLQIIRKGIDSILNSVPSITDNKQGHVCLIDWNTREGLRPPKQAETCLVVFARDFQPEGDDCDAFLLVKAYKLGWKRFIVFGLKGQRFTGCGFGASTEDVRIDVYGSSGDYLASGIDGMQIYIHDNGQDQLGQIMKDGKLVVYGDVGQTFMYGAKGGEVYIMGNAAGRPLINGVGRPRVVINGTCLDFLAESFMAGDPHKNGGFVILNGIEFDGKGKVKSQQTPYPGSNLFSLASGGAIFVRDPHHMLVPEQLNGGTFSELTDKDWDLILPYLQNNEKYFGISVTDDLLKVDGSIRSPRQVYRKVHAVRLAVLRKDDSAE